jgi:methylmalonyl-CoA epimerase
VKVVGIDHLGVAVDNLDAAIRFYCDVLGMRPGPIEEKPRYGLRLARVSVSNAVIELIEARDWNLTTQRYLERRGAGVYHVGLEVDDLDRSIAELIGRRVRLIDEVPREGDGMRVSFIHPDATAGVLLELVTKTARD